jgi:hypothetical protein
MLNIAVVISVLTVVAMALPSPSNNHRLKAGGYCAELLEGPIPQFEDSKSANLMPICSS